ncbi:MAG: response regulator [Chitinophagaceae bacterium]
MLSKKLSCILLIDDSFDDNTYHKLIISRLNIAERIDSVSDGEEALDYLQHATSPPALIFLDINMPRMNGWEFLEEYEKLPAPMKSRIVMMMLTTSADPDEKQRASKIPTLSGFKTKPLTKEMLTDILQKHFRDHF